MDHIFMDLDHRRGNNEPITLRTLLARFRNSSIIFYANPRPVILYITRFNRRRYALFDTHVLKLTGRFHRTEEFEAAR